MFNNQCFKDYKNQISWGRVMGTMCYIVSIVLSFGGIFAFIQWKKPEVLGYCQVMAGQFLMAGASLYGISKINEQAAVKAGIISVTPEQAIQQSINSADVSEGVKDSVNKVTQSIINKVQSLPVEDSAAPKLNLDDTEGESK